MKGENNFKELRQRMIEKQLKSRGIKDKRVLEAFLKVPRHEFVNKVDQHLAYGDHPLSIGEGQTISQPFIVALMTETLELGGEEKVLEIGTGSGYQTAILAELAREVYTVERVVSLGESARRVLSQLGYDNIYFKIGDGNVGWPEKTPFNGIIVTAAAPRTPDALLEQLAPGGRMVVPVGSGFEQDLMLFIKREDRVEKQSLGGCRFVPLIEG